MKNLQSALHLANRKQSGPQSSESESPAGPILGRSSRNLGNAINPMAIVN